MTEQERILDIESSGLFVANEIDKSQFGNFYQCGTFNSWEYWQIIHFTNEELYYLSDEEIEALNTVDYIEDTTKGRIFCSN